MPVLLGSCLVINQVACKIVTEGMAIGVLKVPAFLGNASKDGLCESRRTTALTEGVSKSDIKHASYRT